METESKNGQTASIEDGLLSIRGEMKALLGFETPNGKYYLLISERNANGEITNQTGIILTDEARKELIAALTTK